MLCRRSLWILSADGVQFRRPQPRVSLDGAQRIGCFDGAMLARVAGKNHPAIVSLRQFEEREHLLSTDLSGFIHDNDSTAGHRLLQRLAATHPAGAVPGQLRRPLAVRDRPPRGHPQL